MDLTSIAVRKQLIDDILGSENKGRKAESLKQTEIYNDRIFQHVWDELSRRFSPGAVEEMPIIASVNLARRIVKEEASVYQNPPLRTWPDLSDDQVETLELIYKDMKSNTKMRHSNESFKLQNQNHVMIIPKNGKLIMRSLRNHHLDKIDDPEDPETAFGYVISTFDKETMLVNRHREQGSSGQLDAYVNQDSDRRDQSIGDAEDYRGSLNRFVVWTKEFNFIMDRRGSIISGDDISNPIGVIPIVDVSIEKDFEYWVRQGQSLTDFTVAYNSLLSDLNTIVMNQGYSQAYLIAKDELIPDNLQVGPSKIIKLAYDEADTNKPEFGFATPNSDIAGSIQFVELLINNFLTSRGVDPKTVGGTADTAHFTSGIEKLLSMIESFEASRDDYDTYRCAEAELYSIVRAWHNAALPNDLLDRKYKSTQISDDSEMVIVFEGPEMIQTAAEKVDMWQVKIEAGLASRVDALMDLEELDKEDAEERLKEIEEAEGMDANIEEESNQNFKPIQEFPEVGQVEAKPKGKLK